MSIAAKLLASVRTAKKSRASGLTMERAREALERKVNGRSFRVRKISRIEKMPDRNAYREILECGHAGDSPVFGPQRLYIGLKGSPIARRCYECKP